MTSTGMPKQLALLSGHHSSTCNDVVFIESVSAIISCSADRTILIWLKRNSGDYWPSAHTECDDAVTSLEYNEEMHTLFAGLSSGSISEFKLASDYNAITLVKGYKAHTGKVNEMKYDAQREMLFSCSADKSITLSSTAGSGKRLCSMSLGASCLNLQYDPPTLTTFVGDFSGQIHVLSVDNNKLVKKSEPLAGHEGSIQALLWVPEKQWLFSGSFDRRIIMWDVGGKNGDAYELQSHELPVRALYYSLEIDVLISVGDDVVIAWDMAVERKVTPEWVESEKCQLCDSLFFFSLKEMWEQKKLSMKRQHHCRVCGKAVCADCSSLRSTYPIMGYEKPQRVCDECRSTVKGSNLTPLGKKFPFLGRFQRARFHDPTKRMLVALKDGGVKVVDIQPVLRGSRGASSSSGKNATSAPTSVPTTTATTTATAVTTAIVDMTTRSASDDEDDGEDIFAAIANADEM